ncbi:17434_t:CDS:10 [Cetraspora pellucida]|uniref:17434_t:CDS:1 n=1 Tax=Cetraspora pellucida TaxID=1433469 RepID=A0ACA9L7F3_9GLOM|nr:17434_t:CDS:10 [Cetraspora pellucida]
MSNDEVHEYFNRRYTGWCIFGFLNKCDAEPFKRKTDLYIKSLQAIINREKGKRNLIDCLSFKTVSRATKQTLKHRQPTVSRPDGIGRKSDEKAREWEKERKSAKDISGPSVHFHQPTITDSTVVGSVGVNEGTFSTKFISKKRNQEHQKEEKRTKIKITGDEEDKTETIDNNKDKIETTGKIETGDDYEDEAEDNENFEFDFDSVIKSLQQEPLHEWKVGSINVTQKFREYQQEVLETLKTTGLTWQNTYEVLNCPYPNFIDEEWQTITLTNKYTIHEPVISASVSTAIHEAVIKHLSGQDSYMHADETPLSRAVARTFNELRDNVPDLAPQRTSEDEHCLSFLNPYITSIFLKKNNNYEVRLNRAVKGTKQRPDLSCVVDDVPLLNSEIKPMGVRPLSKKKDFVKVHLRARKTINQQLTSKGGPGETVMLLNHGDIVQTYFMDLQFDGLYRSWPFLTTKLAIDEPSLPLVESNFAHFVALERRVCEFAKDYKRRKGPFTPPLQIQYMRNIPDSPQIRNILDSVSLLKELHSKLLAEISELRKENAEIKAENTELKQDKEEIEARFVKLKQKNKEKSILITKLQHDVSLIKEQSMQENRSRE